MTNLEMSNLFELMILAWPNADMFKGGIEKLGPTIKLWNKCLPGLDYRLAEQAVIRLCRKCKFPPTVAEMLEQTELIKAERRKLIAEAKSWIQFALMCNKGLSGLYAGLEKDNIIRRTIDRMGGPEKVYTVHDTMNGPVRAFDWERFDVLCFQVLDERKPEAFCVTAQKSLGQKG